MVGDRVMGLVLVIVLIGTILTAIYSPTLDKNKPEPLSIRDWAKLVSSELSLTELADDNWNSIGVNAVKKELAIIDNDGTGFWIEFNRIAHIELVPTYSTSYRSTSSTSTRRGSQLLGAGIGSAIAGPAGLIVGGLSGKTRTTTQGSSTESLSSVELKLRLRSSELPFLSLTFRWLGTDLETIAARVENFLDGNPPVVAGLEEQAFRRFSVVPRPVLRVSWWTKTFG